MEGFSKDGRKLRPRKKTTEESARTEKVNFKPSSGQENEDRRPDWNENSGARRPQGNHRSFTEHPSQGGHRSFGEHRKFGEHRGEPRQYGVRRSSEGRPAYGERKPYNGERDFPQRPSGEERRSYRSTPPQGEHRDFGQRQFQGEHRGEPRQYGVRRSSEGRPTYGERKPYSGERSFQGKSGFKGQRGGGKRTFNRSVPTFTKESEEGINRMISRRPRVDEGNLVDFNANPNTIQSEIRLNKFIANSGVCSRREADTLILAGTVTVNGTVVTELGTKVNIFDDDVRFNGQRLKGEEKVYIVMNKPKGFVTTASDPHAEKTVLDLVKECKNRVYPVGRLDKNTTGVLMLTNDGEIAERLTHPSYDKKKIYQVALERNLEQEDYEKILSGITLSDGNISADSLEYIDAEDHSKLGIEIHSGKNRVVRRIFESLGYTVKALDRVYFAGLTKRGLKKGEWRFLSESEVNILRMGAYV